MDIKYFLALETVGDIKYELGNKNKVKVKNTMAYEHLQELMNNYEKLERAYDSACRLAIQKNSGSYITINRGTKEQYDLPLTLDDVSNIKILKEYLFKESEDK